MARMTIAQIRARQVETIARYKTDTPTEQDMTTARTLLNSYYRLCGLADRNLYMANDERRCNTRYCAMSEEKEERWIKNLSERMRAFNALIVDYFGGYLPEILQVTGPRSVDRRQVLTPYFYD